VLTAYCARGSLEDVLANKDLHLDNMFVASLVSDILKVNKICGKFKPQ
jgi:guanylate cyclase